MYRAMLKSLDRGNKAYELGQTDGCEACECNKCKAFANTDDWGEKLWVLHRNMAQRLLKDRPDKKVIILSYYGTANPPKTFKKFPENVIVEKCTYSQKSFDDWKGYTVPQGFMAYVYNWGGYSSFGITAKTTPAFAVEQVKLFKKNNVKAVFRCGFGECFGMEGPVYYAYGRAWDDPVNANAQKLSDEYCEAAFGKVAPQMKKFYDTLYERLGFFMSQKLAYPDNPRLILAYIYSPDLLKILEENLESAEKNAKSEKVKKRLQIVRLEFDYASNLAKTLHLYNAYLVNPDWRSFNALAAAIDQRNAMIEKLSPGESVKKLADWPDLSLFGNMKKSNLKRNGTGKVIGAPLTWQTKLIKSKKILPGINKPRLVIKEINTPSLNNFDFNKGDWKAIAYQDINEIQLGKLEQPSKFKMAYDKNNLYIVFNCDLPAKLMNYTPVGRDGSVWKQDCLEIFIDPEGTREKNYHFMFNPIPDSFYDASNGFLKDPLHPLFAHDFPVWNGKWEYNCKLIPEKNKWFAIVKIPFKTLELTTPKKNSYILLNIGREHYKTKKKVKAREELSLWSPNLEAMSFMDRESYGTIIFGGK